MRRWWKDLSVSKKLTLVVGTLAVLVVCESVTLFLAMDTLSAIRAFVGGEANWSKAQKDAVQDLHRYAATGDSRHYEEFKHHVEIPAGLKRVRLEMEKATPDLQIIHDGFVQGGIHPGDVAGLVRLFARRNSVSYMHEAVTVWSEADGKMNELSQAAAELDRFLSRGEKNTPAIFATLDRIEQLNKDLTAIETRFSAILGAGSRAMERRLMVVVLLSVAFFTALSAMLAISFARTLGRGLSELTKAAQEIGRGHLELTVPVRSRDELGQLAEALNRMATDLRRNIGRRREAENANQVKTMFLANMSHEIRTPLGVILGLVELLKDPSISWTEHENYVDTIERTGKNLTRLINDIIDISKVEAGHLEIEKTVFPLNELIDELKAMLSHKAESGGNRLVFSARSTAPGMVSTDRVRLRQILTNLIGNALKFTDRGTVRVVYGTDDRGLFFEVSDTGIGIPAKEADQLFGVFSRGQSEGAAREGSGLGLALAKRLAAALGGDVTLKETRVGEGSTFVVWVKNEAREEAKAPPAPLAATSAKPAVISSSGDSSFGLKGKKVLVVEDALDNQFLIRAYLAKQDINVDIANNGEEGVNKALSLPYDLVLMDMQMPVMDGYTATETLRKSGYRKPIVALTAHAMKEDRERCLRAGCDEYLTKPIESSLLYQTISRFVS